MNKKLWEDMQTIVRCSISVVMPDAAIKRALQNRSFPGRVYLVSVGKAGWQMAKAAWEILGSRITDGIIITKYHHNKAPIGHLRCYEAGHPVPDENTFRATGEVLRLTENLQETDTVLFLLSGGGSALFELPLVSGEELQDITGQLLASGADIVEMNTVRKRLSGVKGGSFAKHCLPAKIYSVILSDIVGDPLDMIASGPACGDSSTSVQALEIAKRYGLNLSREAWLLLEKETPKAADNVETRITGSVRQLCRAASEICRELGYEPMILTDSLACEARDAGVMLGRELRKRENAEHSIALIAGGETVVTLTGTGKGGRNQEIALAAAPEIAGMKNACVFSVGSDGTDGPTDAAGGYVDGDTAGSLRQYNLDAIQILQNNDAYHGLQQIDSLIFTGPTGTNVNDVSVALLRKEL